MKKLTLLCLVLLAGCASSSGSAELLINTFRNPELLFQLNYPKDWHITDYNDYRKAEDGCYTYENKDSYSEKYGKDMAENCGEGVVFQIANNVVPWQGYNIETSPKDYNSIRVEILPYGTTIKDYDENEPSAKVTKKEEIKVSDNDSITLLVYDSKDYEKDDMMYPHIKAFYYGGSYSYSFYVSPEEAATPFKETDKNYQFLKSILSTFKEIK